MRAGARTAALFAGARAGICENLDFVESASEG